MISKTNEEQDMLLAIEQAKSQQNEKGTYKDKKGKIITISIKKSDEKGICSPYDCF